jgi:hypothetical protein
MRARRPQKGYGEKEIAVFVAAVRRAFDTARAIFFRASSALSPSITSCLIPPLLKFEWVQFPGQGRAQPGEANP